MKRLYRSRTNRVIAGVCGGLAEYLNVDPVLIRLIAVLLLFVGGGSLIAYILGMIIIPDQSKVMAVGLEPASIPNPPSTTTGVKGPGQPGGLIVGFVLILLGLTFLLRKIPFFHQYYWWFLNMGWNFLWPSILIAVGLLIIFRAARNTQSG